MSLVPLSNGAEILFDYRLSPGYGRPGWYVPVDEQQLMRRWSMV